MSGLKAPGLDWQVSQAQFLGARERQEDALRLSTLGEGAGGWHLALVCDGMGGHEGGQQAANLAADTFLSAVREQTMPADGKAAAAILEHGLERAVTGLSDNIAQGGPPAMGTTLAAVLVRGRDLAWISVGDSLLLHRRARTIRRLNADHSMVPILEGLVAAGRISHDEAAQDPKRSALRSVIGAVRPALCDCQFRPGLLAPGDDLLLASDGLSTLSDPTILAALAGPASAQTLVDKVVSSARPYQDNASLILMRAQGIATGGKIGWWRRLLRRAVS
ncbi:MULTISPECIES: PP2C family serine/threonine-protein phosphatase [unclassified Azospirillum]|uniref:PP2C family protein-serine/threonine phosphatase n=1 Tax=unclassified Azospirillum TaxID=2630922 RepID=UPI000B6B72E9|nr:MULTISPECIES: PP2C family serine/threonine-protein phosphatase [unclassified Azospirillum]SNS23178.1 Serine/threonine protein phosphatase PrpC [Azospirillum sp. RU38E]SNS41305.1 Serine/threonine protein phosphatase PrpC [Azospirillum sp. RU37A]